MNSHRKQEPQLPQWSIDTIGDPGEVALTDTKGTHTRRPFFLRDRNWTGAMVLVAMKRVMESVRVEKDGAATVSVISGVGGFSKVRLGAVIANALAWALGWEARERDRRVNIIRPRYEKPPNITQPPAKKA